MRNGDTAATVPSLLPEERRVLLLTLLSAAGGMLQIVFSYTIPFYAIGVLGALTVFLDALLVREVRPVGSSTTP